MLKTANSMLNDIELKILEKNSEELFRRNGEVLEQSKLRTLDIVSDVEKLLRSRGFADFVKLEVEGRIESDCVKSSIMCAIDGFPTLQLNLIAKHPTKGSSRILSGHIVWELFSVVPGEMVEEHPMVYESDEVHLDIIRLINHHLNTADV